MKVLSYNIYGVKDTEYSIPKWEIRQENITTIYLIRHSTKFNPNMIDIYNSTDNEQLKTEKKMLSVEGEKRAELLAKQEEFKNIDALYSSNYVRAMQTAKYFMEENNVKLNIDERFNERKTGIVDKNKYPDFFVMQYLNENFKMNDGESQIEVRKRMTEAFWEVVKNNRNKRSIIVSHGTAISFLLMNWCKLLDIQENLLRMLEFNGKIIINRIYRAPEVFKILINDANNIVDICNIEFEELK